MYGKRDIVDSINPADFSAVLDFSKVKSVNDKSIDIDGPYYAKMTSNYRRGDEPENYSPGVGKILQRRIMLSTWS